MANRMTTFGSLANGSSSASTGAADVPTLSGKVMLAFAARSSSPLRIVIVASHGPPRTASSSTTSTGAVAPTASVVPTVAGNGPAESPPGPSDRVSSPPMSSARSPVLRTRAVTTGRPSAPRAACRLSTTNWLCAHRH